MRRRPLLLAALAISCAAPLAGVDTTIATAASSVTLDGHGYGHGYGLSQWGAYGYAVDHGWSSAQILDHYYGGTVAASMPLDTRITVRLQLLDGGVEILSHLIEGTGEGAVNAVGHVAIGQPLEAIGQCLDGLTCLTFALGGLFRTLTPFIF